MSAALQEMAGSLRRAAGGFLPTASRPPHASSFHAISIPARTFTGDFWLTHRAADRLWFAVGDVAGKGLPAALVMAMIQEELERQVLCDPAATMRRLDRFLRPLLPRNKFATVVIGCLCDDGTLQLVNAGHCPPLIARASGAVEQVESTGPVVGILPVARWRSVTYLLDPGDTLVIYTDGVVEAASPSGEEFGVARAARAIAGSTAREVTESIVRAVERHGAREDDVTVLAITR
jgi:serine phosphatase RsbU (regulator of sigma subunit)